MAKFISRQDTNRAFEMQVVDDSGEKIDWFIQIVGKDSDARREKENEQVRSNQTHYMRTKSLVLNSNTVRQQALDLAVVCTVGWRGKDALAEFSKAEAARIYDEYPGIFEQVESEVSRRENFTPKPATNS